MANVQHANIIDSQRHEPKGASTASVNTIYSSDGAGSGVWAKVGSKHLVGLTGDAGNNNLKLVTDGSGGFITRTNVAYGSMTITANTNAISLTAAVDGTLNTNSDYVLLTGTGAPWVSENLKGITFNTNRLIVPVTGIYKLDLWSTITGWPTNAAKVSVKYRISGGTYSTRHPVAKAPSVATDPGELTGFGHIALVANDFLQLYVASSTTGGLIFQDLNTTLTLVEQTA